MADYTYVVLLTLTLCFNYLLVYKKNKMVGDILMIATGAASLYITTGYSTPFIGFSYILIIIGVIAFLYDTIFEQSGMSVRG